MINMLDAGFLVYIFYRFGAFGLSSMSNISFNYFPSESLATKTFRCPKTPSLPLDRWMASWTAKVGEVDDLFPNIGVGNPQNHPIKK